MTDRLNVSYQRLVEIRHMSKVDTGKTVLVVEDNQSSRDALRDALQNEGYEVVAVGNGLEALDLLRWTWRPACVVLDMRLPVMTGWELRQIMRADPALRDIPVIGMTGGQWKPEDAHGFLALMAKPVKFDELLGKLEAAWQMRVSAPAPTSQWLERK
jgi:CheY-like chemotaxis protein